MKAERYKREVNFYFLSALTKELLSSGLISEEDCSIIAKELENLYSPLIAQISP